MKLLPIALLGAMTVSADAQGNCAERERVIARLEGMFGESRQSIGLGSGGAVMEVYASPDTGTWTIIVTTPRGLTCVVGAGTAFETMTDISPTGEPL